MMCTPTTRREDFYRRLLEANATMGGMAGFALQPDGWVVLHAGRSRKGLDAHELAMLVSSVGRFVVIRDPAGAVFALFRSARV